MGKSHSQQRKLHVQRPNDTLMKVTSTEWVHNSEAGGGGSQIPDHAEVGMQKALLLPSYKQLILEPYFLICEKGIITMFRNLLFSISLTTAVLIRLPDLHLPAPAMWGTLD